MLCYEPSYIIKRADFGAEIGHLDFRHLSPVWIEFSKSTRARRPTQIQLHWFIENAGKGLNTPSVPNCEGPRALRCVKLPSYSLLEPPCHHGQGNKFPLCLSPMRNCLYCSFTESPQLHVSTKNVTFCP